MRRKQLILAIPAALLAFLPLGCVRDSADTEHSSITPETTRIQVEVEPVTCQTLSARVVLTGNLLPRRRTIIVSEIDGVIQAMPKPANTVKELRSRLHQLDRLGIDWDNDPLSLDLGDEVKKGETLVKLIPRDFELQLQAAEAQLTTAKSELARLYEWRRPEDIRRLEAAVTDARTRYETARAELQRTETLLARGTVSTSDYEARRMESETARAQLQQAQAELDIAKAGPTQAEIKVAQAQLAQAEVQVSIAKQKLTKTVIVAPYDAVVTDRFVDIGDRVTAMPRVEIMEINDLNTLLAMVAVPERFLTSTHIGDPVDVAAEGVRQPITGWVAVINDKVDLETRTFRIRVIIDNRQRKLKVGEFARVSFSFQTTPNALTVPVSALTYSDGQPQLFTLKGDRVAIRSIELGITDAARCEVIAGLTKDDIVVTDDPSILADGMQVEVRQDVAEKPSVASSETVRPGTTPTVSTVPMDRDSRSLN